jgi:hypothetical protein
MDKALIARLQKMGIDTDKNTIDIFEDLLNIAEHLWAELEVTEEQRFREQLERLTKKPTN